MEILTWAAELEGFLVVFYFNFIHHISNGDDSHCFFLVFSSWRFFFVSFAF